MSTPFSPEGASAAPYGPQAVPEHVPGPVAPEEAPKAQAAPPHDEPEEFTHYVHLADGRVIKATLDEHPLGDIFTEDAESDHPRCTRIIGVYAR